MPEDTLTAPVDTGEPVEAGTKLDGTLGQPSSGSEDVSATQVEGSQAREGSSEGETRPKPSDYVRMRRDRQRMAALEQKVTAFESYIAGFKQPTVSQTESPKVPKVDVNKLVNDPDGFISDLLGVMDQRVAEKLNASVPDMVTQHQRSQTVTRQSQEALDILFPKKGQDDVSTLEERIANDPVRADELTRIISRHKLNEMSLQYPIEAAQLALAVYEKEKQSSRSSPNALKKSLVGSTATGTMNAGGKPMPTHAEVKEKLNKLDELVSMKPDLRYDEGYRKQRGELREALRQIVQAEEKGKGR
jgi:hypothetical protein